MSHLACSHLTPLVCLGWLCSVPVFVCCFLCHFNVLPVFTELRKPTRDRGNALVSHGPHSNTCLGTLLALKRVARAGRCMSQEKRLDPLGCVTSSGPVYHGVDLCAVPGGGAEWLRLRTLQERQRQRCLPCPHLPSTLAESLPPDVGLFVIPPVSGSSPRPPGLPLPLVRAL